jgi:hypothetical protein
MGFPSGLPTWDENKLINILEASLPPYVSDKH